MPTQYLVRYSGDLSTKADGTKQRFSRRLSSNIEDALSSAGLSFSLRRERFRLYVEAGTPAAHGLLERVFGIQSFSRVERRPCPDLETVVAEGEKIFREDVAGRRFAVRARRGGQVARIPFRSTDVERELGTALLPGSGGVDLTHPEVTVFVEAKPGEAYFFTDKRAGEGGLPLGVGGRALSLVSGGFDSAVASWLMLKRGVRLDYVFFNLGGDAHREGVLRVMKVIADQWSYGYRPRMIEVDFAPVVEELRARAEPRYWQILLKRQMVRAAARTAEKIHAAGLVTGEAVGQVSSQTLENLAVISRATEFPILRPLLGFNKNEIIALSRKIGTQAFSAGVEEYCAILPRHPATHASPKAMAREEARLSPDLLDTLLQGHRSYDLRSRKLPIGGNRELEVSTIRPGATVLDLRSKSAYRAWHFPGALYMDFDSALKAYRSFDPDRTYVLYCEVGQKSSHLAELLSHAGYSAFHVRRGIRTLLRQVEGQAEA